MKSARMIPEQPDNARQLRFKCPDCGDFAAANFKSGNPPLKDLIVELTKVMGSPCVCEVKSRG